MDNLSKALINVYNAIEEQMLINIAKRIKRSNDLLEEVKTSGEMEKIKSWQLEQLSQLGNLSKEQIEVIAKNARKIADEVENILRVSGYQAVDEIEEILERQVGRNDDIIQPPTDAKDSNNLMDILQAYEDQSLDKLNLVNSTMIDQSNVKYRDLINKTVGKVLSGTVTPQQALRESVQEIANRGFPALIDRAGREWTPEAYVDMTIRSTRGSVARSMQEERIKDYGGDLVEISAHDGARPNCEPYQGRIYSLSGNHPRYPSINETSIGEPDGLFGINCGHEMTPYFEGEKKTYTRPDTDENNEIYEESQKQRYYEREIRKSKRELRLMEEIGDEEGIKNAKNKIRNQQSNMRAFIEETGRTRRYYREQMFD